MKRLTTSPRPSSHTSAPASRRAGTSAIAFVAVAAACFLAACGPEDQTVASNVQTPSSTTTTTTTVVQRYDAAQAPAVRPIAAPSGGGQSAAVRADHLVKVADRRDERATRAVYGQVSSIEPITQTPKTSGAGAVVGGVLGAVVGNQIGSGNGRAAATVLGGVGGAVVGNKVEKHRSETVTGYRVHVQLDNGGSRSFDRTNLNGLDVGDRVRVDGGRMREV